MGIGFKSEGVHRKEEIPPESAYFVSLELGDTVKSGQARRMGIELGIRMIGVLLQELKQKGRSTGIFHASLSRLFSELSWSVSWSQGLQYSEELEGRSFKRNCLCNSEMWQAERRAIPGLMI